MRKQPNVHIMYIKYSKMDREVVCRYHLYWVLIGYHPCWQFRVILGLLVMVTFLLLSFVSLVVELHWYPVHPPIILLSSF